jgi:prophage regulatory protein
MVPTAFLRLPQVIQRTGMSRSTIYKMISKRTFPSPVRIGVRAVAWVEGDVESWSQARVTASAPANASRQCSAPRNETEAPSADGSP